ncbi:spermidine synthase [Gayadomonas joobiniege]|uniref:spermidine synthase n=1 Tax=Gayadomonas joobiniege TaxID=1234606 RepID=UPI0003685E67|nr:methyltransferase domain-containing protein [Gayadomonas joobiniege]
MLVDLKHSLVQGQLLTYLKQNSVCWQIQQNENYRWLLMDETIQSVMSLEQSSLLTLPHQQPLKGLVDILPQQPRVLELGLGGGSNARYIISQRPEAIIDVVECSQIVIDWFDRYFNPTAITLHCHKANAGDFLQQPAGQFDLLISDIFNQQYSVFSQLLETVLPRLARVIKPHGFAYLNFIPDRVSEGQQLKRALLDSEFKLLWGEQIIGFKNWVYLVERR